MVNGNCEALRECKKGFCFANRRLFDTETSKSIKCDLETFRFLDVQTSETNLHFKMLKKISRVRDSFLEKNYNNNKKTNKLETRNAHNRKKSTLRVRETLRKFWGDPWFLKDLLPLNNDRVNQFLRHTLDHEK